MANHVQAACGCFVWAVGAPGSSARAERENTACEMCRECTERGAPGSAWEEWRAAGVAFARQCRESRLSVVPLGEESAQYAASRGMGNQAVIRRAFVRGYHDAD